MSDAPLSTLPNLGPVTQGWLEDVGIRTVDELRHIGALEAFRRMKFMLPHRVSVNALYALEAALRGCHWLHLPPDVKNSLHHEAKAMDIALRRAATRCATR